MKKLTPFVFAVLLAASSYAADTLPLFNATLSVGKEQRFVLVSSTGKASSWLGLGESFEGYKLSAYDAKTGELSLDKNGKVTKVTLVSDAATIDAPKVTPATLADAEAVLNKMHFDEMMNRALERQKKAVAGSMEQMAARMGNMPGVNKDDYVAFRQKITDEIMSAFDVKQLKADATKIYSEVFTKEELDQVSAFYSTPLGETMAKKLPDVQDKLGAVVQGRMMDIMPKIQQMSRDFAIQQKARMDSAAAAPAPVAPPAK
jgi:hypothetical protein